VLPSHAPKNEQKDQARSTGQVAFAIRPSCKKHKTKIIDDAVDLFGYHRKAAVRALLNKPLSKRVAVKSVGRPREYEAHDLLAPLKDIWLAANQPCSKLLVAALPIWVPAYEGYHRSLKSDVRDQLLEASASTIDRLLKPLRVQYGKGPCGTKPGSILRQEIPIRGGLWEEDKPGFIEIDTVALCGGRLDDRHAWMLDGVDICTTWVEVRALENRGQEASLKQLQDIEKNLPFALLGVDSDNGGEFLNWHVLRYWQQRAKPVKVTRSRAYHKDDNAHVEQKNWTHVRQWFGYGRYDNPEVVPMLNALCKGAWGQLLNFFCPTMKLEKKEREGSTIKRIYDKPQTPLQRVLASADTTEQKRTELKSLSEKLNPFALRRQVEEQLQQIERVRQIEQS
jgi:hypothetical protein